MEVVSTPDVVSHFDTAYSNCSIRYGDLKKQLAQDINKTIDPIRQKIHEYSSNQDYLRKVVKMGQEKARESASKTLKEVRQVIGFREF